MRHCKSARYYSFTKKRMRIFLLFFLVENIDSLIFAPRLKQFASRIAQMEPPVSGVQDSVAQLVEQYTFNVWVLGSSPSGITKERKSHKALRFVTFLL